MYPERESEHNTGCDGCDSDREATYTGREGLSPAHMALLVDPSATAAAALAATAAHPDGCRVVSDSEDDSDDGKNSSVHGRYLGTSTTPT